MNVSDGGAQLKLHDTIMPGGRVQKMTTEAGEAIGLRTVLTERGINCKTLKKDDMIKICLSTTIFETRKLLLKLT